MQLRALVIGCRPGNLGDAIRGELERETSAVVHAADLVDTGLCDNFHQADVTCDGQMKPVLGWVKPHLVVYCAGVNEGDDAMEVNFYGAAKVLNGLRTAKWAESEPRYFIGVSSNSAHIARSPSAEYCASKAAMSMYMRCVAREEAKQVRGCMVWGYEPGWIADTPMSREVENTLGDTPPHRIPGGYEVDRELLAQRVVFDWKQALKGDHVLNGCMIRIDGGEQ